MNNYEPALTPADRCDACGARAYAIAVFNVDVLRKADGTVTGHNTSALLFCGHHWLEHELNIRTLALECYDELALRAVRA